MKYQIFSILLILSSVCFAKKQELNPDVLNPASPEEAKFLQEIAATGLNLPTKISVMLSENINLDMMFIPAGTFFMGSPNNERLRRSDESPLHKVEITKNFYLGKFEVSQLQYGILMGMRKTKFTGGGMPMENVNWFHVNGFIGSLTNKFGLKFRLPSEAEWEYACRAGTRTPFYTGQSITPEQANYDYRKSYNNSPLGMYLKMTSPVGKYPSNAFGLHDMHGNVWEWCNDFYDSDYYKKSPETDPKGPVKGKGRVVRGGAWNTDPDKLRSAVRENKGHGADKKYLGFRVLLEIPKDYDGRITQVINPINQSYVKHSEQTQSAPKIEHELIYDEETQQGSISVTGKGLEARNWMLNKIAEVCSSKNIVMKEGKKPEAGYYRLLDEELVDGVYTIKFEAIR